MAIKAYNAGVTDNGSVPVIDLDGKIEHGDMLYFDKSRNLFVPGPGITVPTKLSEFENDIPLATNAQLQEAIANGIGGGEINLDGYATEQFVNTKISALPRFSGDYYDLANKPDIPNATSDLTNDSGFITASELQTTVDNLPIFSGRFEDLINKPTIFSGSYNDLSDRPILSDYTTRAELEAAIGAIDTSQVDLTPYITTANAEQLVNDKFATINTFSGDYNDLINKPTIFSGRWEDITNRPVLFSGSYNDLTDAPSIPSLDGYASIQYVTDAIAQAQLDGQVDLSGYVTQADLTSAIPDVSNFLTEVQIDAKLSAYQPTIDLSAYYTKSEVDARIPTTFSGNYADLVGTPTIPTVPTDVSAFANDAGYITSADIPTAPDLTPYALKTELPTVFSGDYNDLSNKPTLPTALGDLTNNVGYATETYVDTQVAAAVSGGSIDLSGYVTDAELATAVGVEATARTASDQNLQQQIDAIVIPDVSGFVTNSELQTELANYQPTVDLTSYYTKTEVDALIPSTISASWNDITDKPTLFSGSYADLTDAPAIPDITGLATEVYVQQQLAGYQPTIDLSAYYTKTQVDALIDAIETGTVDLTGYATETFVSQQIANASIGGIANLDDLSDVAVGSLPQQANENEHYLLEYNPVNELWESRDFGSVFATQQYVTETVATIITDGDINLDGYATEQFVEQKLVERGPHFSGNYYDLSNTPILFSGDYRDLTNKPADNNDLRMQLVGNELQLLNIEPDPDTLISSVDLGELGAAIANDIDFNNLSNLPDFFSGDYNDLVNRPNLFSGSYHDLRNKPYIPSIAGLATEEYVDNRWAEPEITGDRYYKDDVILEQTVTQKTSIVSHEANEITYAMAIQTTGSVETQVVLSNNSNIAIELGTTAMFKATVVAVSDDYESSFVVRGIINHRDAGISIVGTNTIETIADSDQGWTANLTAGTGTLDLSVIGSETTVDWTIFLTLTSVKR